MLIMLEKDSSESEFFHLWQRGRIDAVEKVRETRKCLLSRSNSKKKSVSFIYGLIPRTGLLEANVKRSVTSKVSSVEQFAMDMAHGIYES